MRRTQGILFWSAAAWLVLSTSLIVAHAPWVTGLVWHYLTLMGLAVLLVGLFFFLKDVWRYPEPRRVWKRLLIIVPTALVAVLAVAWVALLRIPFVLQEALGHGLWGLLRLEPYTWDMHWQTIKSFYGYGSLGYLYWLPKGIESSAFPYLPGALVGLAWLVPASGICIAAHLVLRRVWVRQFHAAVTMRRWVVLLGVVAAALFVMDRWGYEAARRVGAATHVGLLDAGITEWRARCGEAIRGQPMRTLSVTGRAYGASRVHFPIPIATGQCLIFNGRRMKVGPSFGQGVLCRFVNDDVPLTRVLLVDPAGTIVETIEGVEAECDVPPRHVFGEWVEVANGTERLGSRNPLRVTNSEYTRGRWSY